MELNKELLHNGENVHYVDKDGNTSLMIASHYGHLDKVKELLLYGANINLKNNYGISSLIYAAENGIMK